MLDPALQLAIRRRPQGEAAMRHCWRDLGFFHFPVEPEIIQSTLPIGLTVDTFPDQSGIEKAWLGLVTFSMHDIRPPFLPAAPWISAFLETNVRTYVHHNGSEPGVYFYSLDAQRRLACDYARVAFGLNYLHSEMSMTQTENVIDYRIRRLDEPHASLRLEFKIGDELPLPQPGSLEFFLIERYLLYSEKTGRLGVGQVWHDPYPLRIAKILRLDEDLFDSMGLPRQPMVHAVCSPGVDVEVFSLEALIITS